MTFFDAVVHLFIPHDSNNHRPRLLHPHAFLAYVVFIVFFGFGIRAASNIAPEILGIATNISVEDLLYDTNLKRQESDLPPLILNPKLSQAAYNKAQNMFSQNYWAHFGPNGESPWDFIVSSGYSYSFAGENLAKDFNESSSVVQAWMDSPTHKDNILKSEYKDIGFAVVNGKFNGQETTLVVQMFGTSNSNNQASDNFNIIEESAKASDSQELIVAGVSKLPILNVKTLNKSVTILLLGLLMIVLVLDGILISMRKTIRISGHNIAHILFLGAFLGAVWLTAAGSIR
ncbi:hypothetical protein HYT02_04825 [Candidatus Gottesmanbacteria bacterium]|nr:hypothetical protein [Candidatus Gottesmanbacteria bacterium]